MKEIDAKPGQTNVQVAFSVMNTGLTEVLVNDVRTSCGCTVARLPEYPWRLGPGTNGQIQVSADLRGKRGTLHKMIYVYTANYGTKSLAIKVNIPDAMAGATGARDRNRQIATADRQAVFRNDCASCHAEPAAGKKGAELYAAGCAVCHDAEHRASMVPDLKNLNRSTDRNYWRIWISQGKVGSLMPAFAKSHSGPLTDEQISSLVDYLAEHIPARPVAAQVSPASQ